MPFRSLFSTLLTARPAIQSIQLHSQRVPPKHDISNQLPPLFLIHGILASSSTYRSLSKRPDFAPHREVIGLDLRNHGLSPHVPPEAGMRYEDMAADLIAYMDGNGIEKACMVGHSMGGKVAMELALEYPHRVSELVIVDIAPVTYTLAADSSVPYVATTAMRKVSMKDMHSREDVDQELRKHGVTSRDVRQFVMTNLAATDNDSQGRYRWRLNLESIHKAFPTIMSFPNQNGRTFEGRTCVIRGGKSKYVPFQAMKTVTQLFPKTKLITISDAGHWLQAEAPDEFVKAVNDFLDD